MSNKQYVNTLTSPEGCRGNIGGYRYNDDFYGGGGGGLGLAVNNTIELNIRDFTCPYHQLYNFSNVILIYYKTYNGTYIIKF